MALQDVIRADELFPSLKPWSSNYFGGQFVCFPNSFHSRPIRHPIPCTPTYIQTDRQTVCMPAVTNGKRPITANGSGGGGGGVRAEEGPRRRPPATACTKREAMKRERRRASASGLGWPGTAGIGGERGTSERRPYIYACDDILPKISFSNEQDVATNSGHK